MESVREPDETENRENDEMEDGSDDEVDGSDSEEDDSGDDHRDADAPDERTGESRVRRSRAGGSEHSDSASSRRSAAPSPTDSLIENTASMQLSSPKIPEDPEQISHSAEPAATIKERVASDISRQQARSNKYHSKRSTRKIGRPRGSKAKQDSRVKMDRSGVWE